MTTANIEKSIGELFRRQNTSDQRVAEYIGQQSAFIEQNRQLIGLLKESITGLRTQNRMLFGALVIVIGALIYGALGERGFNAVKNVIPNTVSHFMSSPAIPFHNDLEAWMATLHPHLDSIAA